MSGIIVPLFEQRHLDFSYLAGAASEILTLHTALPVVPYKSGVLMLRIHEKNVGATPAKFLLRLYPTLPCKTDGRQFTNTALAIAEIEVNSASPSGPSYLHADIATVTAAYLLVQLHISQATSPATLTAQLSAELVLRED